MADGVALFTRDELLGGLPARRASTLLFAIESRAAHLVVRARQAMAPALAETTAAGRERAFLEALAQGRDLPVRPTIQHLERYAPQWADLVPTEPGVRAALAQLLGRTYAFTARDVPALRQALGLDDEAVALAYERANGRSLATIFAPAVGWRERLRWVGAGLARRLEELPPFWAAFALTLTETVGAGTLALPIAVAGVGPLAGVALLVVLGLINVLTIAAIAEAFARNGAVRHSSAFFGRLVTDYLGNAGSALMTAALLTFSISTLIAYYIGVATTLAGIARIPAAGWAVLMLLAGFAVLRRETLDATITAALLTGAGNIGLILLMAFLALPHLRPANLLYLNLPFGDGRPFDTAVLGLIFGVILSAYFGHTSIGNFARPVLQRDPSGRALIRGTVAATLVTIVLYCLWVIAVNGAVPSASLRGHPGTALVPLAAVTGPLVAVLGAIYVVLGMGMASAHYSLAIFNQVREWLPAPPATGTPARTAGAIGGLRAAATSRRGRFWLGSAPVFAVFLLVEWLLLTDRASFAGLYGVFGALMAPLLGGIFPMLLLRASRCKGEYVPTAVTSWLSHPVVVSGTYLLFLAGIALHGAVIWHDPAPRLGALLIVIGALGVTLVGARRGSFRPRAIIALRVDGTIAERATFAIVSGGHPVSADVCLEYKDGRARHLAAASGEIPAFPALRSATFDLPASPARELKVWPFALTPAGDSEAFPARLEVEHGPRTDHFDVGQSGGEALVSLDGTGCRVRITLP